MPSQGRRVGALRTLSNTPERPVIQGFQFEVFEDRADALAFLLNRAYTEAGRELQFELDLVDAAMPPSDPPPGIEIVTRAQRPTLVPGMYEVAMDAVPDIPGNEGEGRVASRTGTHSRSSARNHLPELCFIAVHRTSRRVRDPPGVRRRRRRPRRDARKERAWRGRVSPVR